MEENEAGGLGDGHWNGVIPALADDGFLDEIDEEEEEEDDYCGDLHDNMNVGENFLQSVRKNEEEEKAVELRQETGNAAVTAAIVASGISSGVDGSRDMAVRGNETGERDLVPAAMGSMGSSRTLGGGDGSGGTILIVVNLLWWTTDAEVEIELSRYGAVKEVVFYDEIASGKSNGYCRAEFYEPEAAMACRERMDGHHFNGRACVVRFSSPPSLKSMEEARMNRNSLCYCLTQTASVNQINRYNATVGNFQDGGHLGRAGPQMMGVDGVVGRGEPISNAGGGLGQGIGAASSSNHPQTIMGHGFHPSFGGPTGNGGGGLKQGIVAASSSNHPQTMMGQGFHPGLGGPIGNGGGGLRQGIDAASSLIHPQPMMGQGFYSAFRGPIGRMGGYGGFAGGQTLPFPPRLSPFRPAHFRRGMPMNSIRMMPLAGMEGPNMVRWTGDEHGYRAGESSNAAESDNQYGEESRDRGPGPSNRENDRPDSSDRSIDDRELSGRDHDWQEGKSQDDRDVGSSRGCDPDPDPDPERPHGDDNADRHRHRDRKNEHDDEQDKGRSSSTQAKSQSKSKGKAPI